MGVSFISNLRFASSFSLRHICSCTCVTNLQLDFCFSLVDSVQTFPELCTSCIEVSLFYAIFMLYECHFYVFICKLELFDSVPLVAEIAMNSWQQIKWSEKCKGKGY